MIVAFVTLAGTVLSILFWLMKNHAAKAADPVTQNAARYVQIDQDLTRRDSLAATLHATDDLDTLDRLQNSGPSH